MMMNLEQLRKALDLIAKLDDHLANFTDIQDYQDLDKRYIGPLKKEMALRLRRAESERWKIGF